MVEDISASNRRLIPASVFRRIPGCAGGDAPLSVELLLGGRNVNRNLRIDTQVGRFVLRQPYALRGLRLGRFYEPVRVLINRAMSAFGVKRTCSAHRAFRL